MNIGENVKRIRTEKEMSQLDLADAIGVTQPMISMIERGTKAPSMQLGKQIADALDVSVDKLFL